MALVRPTITPFPIFAPSVPPSISTDTTSSTEVHFSRWNNANADKFIRHQRAQKEIEDDLRRFRRYKSAMSIANLPTTPAAPNNSPFKSIGTPSHPSPPSIPGKKSKYSKNPTPNPNPKPLFTTHPAFRKLKTRPIPRIEEAREENQAVDMRVGEEGVSYVVPGAPFEYMYSYTETPKVKPLALREAPMTPFGPETMARPWTGRKPLQPSKKKVPEFDSFVSPPSKKGVKPVQRPGPFLPGSGPKYVWSRDEILGEPLSREEVTDLVEGCRKSQRQLNMGRDGLTHNMLDNIHSHWKRRRVCKIKCKGVCTVDMDNVCQQLEEKTGGKIIYRRGGVIFLFRGRNYNYLTRPRFPLMLWKPVTPVYPRLIKRVPDGLTFDEAFEMRRRGRDLTPICKLAKNGVYVSLVKDIREAFEACDLVRIDCQGLNPSDYRKIGAKLKDLVPCVLISFENEHVLVWRGREWKSSFSCNNNGNNDASSTISDTAVSSSEDQEASPSGSSSETDDEEASPSCSGEVSEPETSVVEGRSSLDLVYAEDIHIEGEKGSPRSDDEESSDLEYNGTHNENLDTSNDDENKGSKSLGLPCMQDILLLLKQAVESGSAVILDDSVSDADVVYGRSVSLSKVAPPGPVFRPRPRKVLLNGSATGEEEGESKQGIPVVEKKAKGGKNRGKTSTVKGFPVGGGYGGVIPQGSLGVDELAKLLA